MRLLYLYLLLGIAWLLPNKLTAQWEKMPIGTKLYYVQKYTLTHYNDDGSEDTIKGENKFCIRIDTIISLKGKDRKIVLFSEIFDPFGSPYFKVPEEYNHLYNYLSIDSTFCSMFYFFKKAIYGISVPKQVMNLLRNKEMVKSLDDSLKSAIYYSTVKNEDSGYINYEPILTHSKYSKYFYGTRFKIQEYDFTFLPFMLLKGEKYRKKPNSYGSINYAEIPYSDFFGLYRNFFNLYRDHYAFIGRRSDSDIFYSPKKGILRTETDIVYISDEANFEMKLEKIEYPSNTSSVKPKKKAM